MRVKVIPATPIYQVVPTETGHWEVRQEGEARPESRHRTHDAAVQRATALAAENNGHVEVHEAGAALGVDDMEVESIRSLVNGEEVSPTAPPEISEDDSDGAA